MKNAILLLFTLISIFIPIKAQYSLRCELVLPKLELRDKVLVDKLDSIIAVTPQAIKREGYTYFICIEEKDSAYYNIELIYVKATFIERNINTGIYMIGEENCVVRENSKNTLFSITNIKGYFPYTKMLVQSTINNDLIELTSLSEPYIQRFLYSEKGLVQVKNETIDDRFKIILPQNE